MVINMLPTDINIISIRKTRILNTGNVYFLSSDFVKYP